MCLFINIKEHEDLKPKIAKQDIFGYKILLYSSSRKEFYTPYRNVSVDITTHLKCKRFQNTPKRINNCCYIVDKAIHLFSTKKSALDTVRWLIAKTYKTTNTYTFACVYYVTIPKGNKYWIGMYDDVCTKSICFKDIAYVLSDSFVNIGRDSTILQKECITLLKDGINKAILRKFFYSIDVDKIIREYTKAELGILEPSY